MKIDIEIVIGFLMFVTLMCYTTYQASADEEFHAKIKPIKQQYCFTKIITTIKDDVTERETDNDIDIMIKAIQQQ